MDKEERSVFWGVAIVIAVVLMFGLYTMAHAASSEKIGKVKPNAEQSYPTGSSRVDISMICGRQIHYMRMALEDGKTPEQLMEDFEKWLASGVHPILPQYPQMVRNMIEAARYPGWEEGAYQACIRILNGQES